MKQYIARIAITAVMTAAVVGVTCAYGLPHVEEHDIAGGAVVMTIDGVSITENEYNQYLNYYRTYLEGQMSSAYGIDPAMIWEDADMRETYAAQLFEMTDMQLSYNVAVHAQADAMDFTFNRLEKQAIVDLLADSEEYYNMMMPDGLQGLLDQYNISREMYENILLDEQMNKGLRTAYLADYTTEQQTEALNEVLFHAKHILIGKTDEMGMPLEGATYDAKLALAEDTLARVQAGEDFDTVMFATTEDPGVISNPDGYVFGQGEMVLPFEEATMALGMGEISGLVESDFGWHIILREPLDVTPELLASKEDAIATVLCGESLASKIEAAATDADIQYTDAYGNADYAALEVKTARD